jgi:ankyrin repeat protein
MNKTVRFSVLSILVLFLIFLVYVYLQRDSDSMESRINMNLQHASSEKPLLKLTIHEVHNDTVTRNLANAVKAGDTERIQQLVKDGASVNSVGNHGIPVLYWGLGNIQGLQMLLELGADPNARFGETSYVIGFSASDLFLDPSALRTLIAYGANVNVTHGISNSPLLHAPSMKHEGAKEKIDLLISAGANINAKNGFGDTAAMNAVVSLDFEKVNYLIDLGADVNVPNANDVTLLDRVNSKRDLLLDGSIQKRQSDELVKRLTDMGAARGSTKPNKKEGLPPAPQF